jgi:stress response protein YsnF
MAQTVVGFFDDASDARRAIERLAETGISRDNIDIRENTITGNTTVSNDHDRDNESGISRFFKSLFGDDDDEADRYARVGSNSRCIVTVQAASDDQAERAADILDDAGAIDVDERAAQYGVASFRRDRDADRDYDARSDSDETVIPRVEENLEVGKREVERGGVRVRSRIVERPVEETVRLREEHVNVERQAVDRPVSGADEDLFRETEIELTERSEVPVVNKEARVVEEVRISKDVNEREETIRGTVRNTEIDIGRTDEGRIDRDDLRRERGV